MTTLRIGDANDPVVPKHAPGVRIDRQRVKHRGQIACRARRVLGDRRSIRCVH